MAFENRIFFSPPAARSLPAWAEEWRPIAVKPLRIAGAAAAVGVLAAIALIALQGRNLSSNAMKAEGRMSNLEYRVHQANEETAEQRQRVEKLNTEATEQRQRIEKLNTEATELAQNYLALEEEIRPRRLSRAQIHDLVRTWKAYSGRSVTIWSYGMDIEGGALSAEIRDCLVGAHIVVMNNVGRMNVSLPLRVGIEIAGVDERLVLALRAGLREIGGLDAREVELPGDDASLGVPAEIFVGAKPLAPSN